MQAPSKKGGTAHPQYSSHVCSGQTAGWIKMSLGMEVAQATCDRWGPSSPPRKRGHRPQFSAHVYCCQTAVWIKMPLGMEVGLVPGHTVLDGDPAPPPLTRGTAPTFWPVFIVPTRLDGSRCRALGAKVGLGPGHIVLGPTWGPSSPSKKRHSPPPLSDFSPCLLWPNGRISQLLLSTC